MTKITLKKFLKFLFNNKISKFFWNSKIYFKDDLNFQLIKIQNDILLRQIYLSEFKNIKYKSTKDALYHSFNWIEIGKNIGGLPNIVKTRNFIINWYKKNFSVFSFVWDFHLTAERFLNLIYNYDFYSQNANNIENRLLNDIITSHKNILNLEFKLFKIYDPYFTGIKAIFLIHIIKRKKLEKISNSIIKNIKVYFNNNGSHKSYNATIQLIALNNLIEIKNMFLYYKVKSPEILDITIFKSGCYLASLFHIDQTMSFFNGSNNFYISQTNKLLNKIDNIKKYNFINIFEGIAVYHDNKKSVFFDAVSPGKYFSKNNLHASTLSIEISFNNEKIITNCGSLETEFNERPDYLKYSAAHSTIILDNTNISEIKGEGSFKKFPKLVELNQFNNDDEFVIEGLHDGYLPKYGILIKRKVEINKHRNEIKGLDTLVSKKLIGKNKLSYSIRFHLSPNCSCNMTNNKRSIIIKTNKNIVYIFESSSELSIEDSIFISDGKKTSQNKQIVINSIMKNIKETNNWTLKSV